MLCLLSVKGHKIISGESIACVLRLDNSRHEKIHITWYYAIYQMKGQIILHLLVWMVSKLLKYYLYHYIT